MIHAVNMSFKSLHSYTITNFHTCPQYRNQHNHSYKNCYSMFLHFDSLSCKLHCQMVHPVNMSFYSLQSDTITNFHTCPQYRNQHNHSYKNCYSMSLHSDSLNCKLHAKWYMWSEFHLTAYIQIQLLTFTHVPSIEISTITATRTAIQCSSILTA